MPYDRSNVFARILRGELPSNKVYEDEHVLAFRDINPQAPTHILVLPKRHIDTLNDISTEDDQLIGELVRRAMTIAKDRNISSFRTVFNTNREAGQSVFHIHLHLLGGRPMHWPPG